MKRLLIGAGLLAVLAGAAWLYLSQTQKNQTSSTTTKNQQQATTAQGGIDTVIDEGQVDSVSSEGLTTERYDVAHDGKTLYGMITAPADYKDKTYPTIVISHGFNNTLENYEGYANFLAQQGYLVYRFDFYGGSTQSKSGGQDMLDMSVTTEVQDLDAVVAQLSKEAYVDDADISLMGASQGGVVSTLYAAQHPEMVQGLMLIFPAYVLFDDVEETYASYTANGASLPDVITHRNARLGKRYLTDARKIDIWKEVKKVNAPVLIVQGTDDQVVPYDYATKAQSTFANAKLITVDGGGHWIDDHFNSVAMPAIQEFLEDEK